MSIIIKHLHEFLIKAQEKKLSFDQDIILDLEEEVLDNNDIKQLCQFIPLFPNLLISHFPRKTLDDKSIKYLTNAIKKCEKNAKLLSTELDLSDNKIGSLGAKYLADILKKTHENFEINLSGNHVGDLGLYYFACNLKQAPQNFQLNLFNNRIGQLANEPGVTYLVQALKDAPIGFKLNLGRNEINCEMAKQIAEHLKSAPEGFDLNINFNHFAYSGAKAFADNLVQAPFGFKLNLQDCRMDSEVRESFLNSLAKAPHVRDLKLSYYPDFVISKGQRKQLKSLLRKNQIWIAAFNSLTFLKGEFATRLPVEILDQIISYIFPFSDEKNQNKHFVKNVLNFFQQDSITKTVTNPNQHPHAPHHKTSSSYGLTVGPRLFLCSEKNLGPTVKP